MRGPTGGGFLLEPLGHGTCPVLRAVGSAGSWVSSHIRTHLETKTKVEAWTSHMEPCPVTEASGLPREVGSVNLAPS